MKLGIAAASSEEAMLLELFQLRNDQEPCLECFRAGRPVTVSGRVGVRLTRRICALPRVLADVAAIRLRHARE